MKIITGNSYLEQKTRRINCLPLLSSGSRWYLLVTNHCRTITTRPLLSSHHYQTVVPSFCVIAHMPLSFPMYCYRRPSPYLEMIYFFLSLIVLVWFSVIQLLSSYIRQNHNMRWFVGNLNKISVDSHLGYLVWEVDTILQMMGYYQNIY